jgi:4-hydroxy-tetrahydrodipicolinate synthase
MKKNIFRGSGVAIITPFTENGIDFEKLGELIEFQIKNSTDAIIVCGTTGESSTMSEEEYEEVIKYTVEKVNKRIPVIGGSGTNSTKKSIDRSKYCEQVGCDGVLLVTPYYNKTTQKGMIEHFKAIAAEIQIPIILYNVPSRTGLNISAKTAFELSKVDNIVAIKEASGNISQIAEIAQLCGDNMQIYSGNDDQIVPILSLGGIGVISVLANIMPKEAHDIVINFLEGNISYSRELQLKLLPLINALFIEVNPIPVKEALNILGYNVGKCRLPLTDMEDKNKELLRNLLENIDFCNN